MRNNLGWLVVAGFLVVFFSSSIKNTLQVFFVPMAEGFGQSRGEFAVAASVFMLVFGISSPIVGAIADRVGPKKTILFGLFASGVAFIGCALFNSFPTFVFLYGVVAAFGLTAVSYVPMGLLVDQTFSERSKGLVYATLTNGAAIGFVVLSPVWVFSQAYYSWQQIYWFLGVLFLVPLSLLVLWRLPASPVAAAANHGSVFVPFSQSLKQVFRVKPFYVLMLGFMGCGVTMAFIDVHMVAYLNDLKLTPTQVSLALSLLGVLELIGGFLAGWLCDRYSKKYVIAGNYLLRALSLLVLLWFPNVIGVMIFALLFGLSYLGTVIGTSMYALDLFGRDMKGFAFGFIWFAHQVGAVLSTQLGANAYDAFGDYQRVIGGAALVALFSFVISAVFLPRETVSSHATH